jgi:Flp pilus assembly secretin CpaC
MDWPGAGQVGAKPLDPRLHFVARELITVVHIMKLLALISFVLSAVALASTPQRLALPVGNSTTISLPSEVSKVSVADPKKVEIKKSGRTVTMTGLEKGTTEATILTKDGVTKVSIYVAADKYAMPY